jgi:PAS domain S-box-containing protein
MKSADAIANASSAAPPGENSGALLSQMTRLEALFEVVPLAAAIFDEELRLVRANRRYAELTQLPERASLGRSVYDAFPNALADLTEQIDLALRVATGPGVRVPFQQPMGQRIVEVTFAPMPSGLHASGLLFLGADVSEREELREKLGRSVAQLESVFDVIPDSVRVFDADGRVTRSNSQAHRDHPSSPATLRELWQAERPRSLDGTALFMHEHPTARALRGETVRAEVLVVRRGSERSAVIEVNSNALHDASGRVRGAVTVERDVTERTKLAQELEEQVRRSAELYERVSTEAERLERMVQERSRELLELQEARLRERRLTAVGQLAAGVMHDVNNALNPIVAAAYLLDVNADDPRAVRDYAARIARAAETGAATAARVGRFIRQEPLKGEHDEQVDLSIVADEVIAMTRPLWAERVRGGCVELERCLAPGAQIRGIAGEVREALLNLIQNALDAMRDGGRLGIVTRVAGAEAMLEVRDTGAGMSEEVRDRAFEPFFSTKGHGGSGLGLSEVYGIMKRHRGVAEIESAPGAGTTVRLRFPLAGPAPADALPAEPRRVARRVLLVEDNEDGREFMQALLESDGHTVTAVATVRDALARLGDDEAADPPFDVVVSDIGLPDASGWDLVAMVRERWPSLRVGVVTGWEVRTGSGNGHGGGAHFTLRKPVRTQELLGHVGGADV